MITAVNNKTLFSIVSVSLIDLLAYLKNKINLFLKQIICIKIYKSNYVYFGHLPKIAFKATKTYLNHDFDKNKTFNKDFHKLLDTVKKVQKYESC